MTAAFTGLRMGELRALRWRDVDFRRSVIRVRASYAEGELSVHKSGKVRSVPMVPEVAQQLARLAERGEWNGDDHLVFAEAHGDWLNDDKLRRRYDAALREGGLRRLRFHDLRHTFGSLAITRADIVEVQPWVGHADIQTTMRYLHYRRPGRGAAGRRVSRGAHARGPISDSADRWRSLKSAGLSPVPLRLCRCPRCALGDDRAGRARRDVAEMRTIEAGAISCRFRSRSRSKGELALSERSCTTPTRTPPRDWSQPSLPPNIDSVAVAQKIALYDKVELLEPVDTAPAGARGPVNHFLNGGEVAEIELTEPHLEGLDGIVYAPRSKLRRIGLIPPSPGKVPKRPARDG